MNAPVLDNHDFIMDDVKDFTKEKVEVFLYN